MIKKSLSSKGFTTFELVSVVLILGLIGVIGWQVTKEKAATSRVAQVGTHSIEQANSRATFAIPELGIKIINLPPAVADLTDYKLSNYKKTDPNNTSSLPVTTTSVYLSTTSLTKADISCEAQYGALASLGRTTGTYIDHQPVPDNAFVKQFSGFYVSYSHPQAACSNNQRVNDEQIVQMKILQKTLTTPQNIQAL